MSKCPGYEEDGNSKIICKDDKGYYIHIFDSKGQKHRLYTTDDWCNDQIEFCHPHTKKKYRYFKTCWKTCDDESDDCGDSKEGDCKDPCKDPTCDPPACGPQGPTGPQGPAGECKCDSHKKVCSKRCVDLSNPSGDLGASSAVYNIPGVTNIIA